MPITNIVFTKAERKQAKARIALAAPAGGGKTHSALLIAKGLAPNGKIAVIDTENGSASLEAGKANVPEFDVLTMHAPFDPQKYIAGIQAAEAAGYDVIIIDSLTHAWAGTGGLLDKVDMVSKSSKSGNSYTAWRDVTPLHNKLVEAIIQSKAHIIGTMRTKTDYVLESNSKGGMQPKKVGMAPIQREGMDYEFTIVFDVDQASHVATATKDRTSLFDGAPFVPTEKTGELVRTWLEDAPAVADVPFEDEPKAPNTPPAAPTAPAATETPAPAPSAPAAAASEPEAPKYEPEPEEKTYTKPKDISEQVTLLQLKQLRELANTKAGVKDDDNLVNWLDFIHGIAVEKLSNLTQEQAEFVIGELQKETTNA